MTPNEQKAYNLIGIAKKAGKVIGGTDMVADRIREKRNAVKAVLISCDASENTLKKIINTTTFYKVPAVRTNIDKAMLANNGEHGRALCDRDNGRWAGKSHNVVRYRRNGNEIKITFKEK